MTARERTEKDRASASQDRALDDTKLMERPSIDQWSPSTALETPPPTGGYRYRWIAEAVNGEATTRSVQQAIREKYSRVTLTELHENHPDFIVDEDLRGDGFARTGGLILMKIPEEIARQREMYYLNRSREGYKAANTLQGINQRDQVVVDNSRTLEGAQAARRVAGTS